MEWPQWIRRAYQVVAPKETHDEKVTRLAREHDDALAFLDNPGAIAAYQRLLQRYADQILESKPDEVELRQLAYTKAHVLQDMVREMVAAVRTWDMERQRLERTKN